MDNDDDDMENEENERSLREELGLPPLASEHPEPPIEADLVRKFARNEKLSDEEFATVFDAMTRFDNWREAIKQEMRDYFSQKAKPPTRFNRMSGPEHS